MKILNNRAMLRFPMRWSLYNLWEQIVEVKDGESSSLLGGLYNYIGSIFFVMAFYLLEWNSKAVLFDAFKCISSYFSVNTSHVLLLLHRSMWADLQAQNFWVLWIFQHNFICIQLILTWQYMLIFFFSSLRFTISILIWGLCYCMRLVQI